MPSKRNLRTRLFLAGSQTQWGSARPHCQILNISIVTLTGFSPIHRTNVNTISRSPGHVLGAASGSGKGKWSPYSKDGRMCGASQGPGSAHGSTGSHIFSMTFPHILETHTCCLLGWLTPPPHCRWPCRECLLSPSNFYVEAYPLV